LSIHAETKTQEAVTWSSSTWSLYQSGHTWDNLPVGSQSPPNSAEQNNHTGFGFLFRTIMGARGGEGRGSRPSARQARSSVCVCSVGWVSLRRENVRHDSFASSSRRVWFWKNIQQILWETCVSKLGSDTHFCARGLQHPKKNVSVL
jgi:hypothetical protein